MSDEDSYGYADLDMEKDNDDMEDMFEDDEDSD